MSLPDLWQRPQSRALLIGGGLILFLAIALYFATRKKTNPGALDASNPNGLNQNASGDVPTVLVLPPPVVQLQAPPLPTAPDPVAPPPMPGQYGPTGILTQPPIGVPTPQPAPILPGRTGPTGIHA
jgi:hypothetical protein